MKERFLATVARFERDTAGAPAWLGDSRRGALDRFSEIGLPTTRDEDRKYTTIAPLLATDFDLEAEGEAALVAQGATLRADVIKVPHHGSRTSSTAALIGAVRPRVAVVSCGRGNRFGFPAREVVARWAAAGVDLLRTDLHGAVVVRLEPGGRLHVQPHGR